jgi:hypothetical protein
MITTDGQVAFLIPDESRDKYLEWVPGMKHSCGLRNIALDNAAWNVDHDPIIIADRSYFSQKNWGVIATFMNSIGAKDVTEMYKKK